MVKYSSLGTCKLKLMTITPTKKTLLFHSPKTETEKFTILIAFLYPQYCYGEKEDQTKVL